MGPQWDPLNGSQVARLYLGHPVARGGGWGSPFNCQLSFVLLVFYARHVQNDVALNVGPLPGLINGQRATGNRPMGQRASSCNKPCAACLVPHATCHLPLECIDLVFKALKGATPNEAQPQHQQCRVVLVIIAPCTLQLEEPFLLYTVAS